MKPLMMFLALCIASASAGVAQGQEAPGRAMKTAVLDQNGEMLPQATVVAENVLGEPLRANYDGDFWFVTGVGEKTILHVKDPVRGAASVEVNLPAGEKVQAVVNVYWQEKTAIARVVALLPDLGSAEMRSFPSVSPPSVPESYLDTTCPSDSLFNQPVHGPNDSWSAGNSDRDGGYLIFENFSGLSGDVCDLRFWGLNAFFDPIFGFTPCVEGLTNFEIKFYDDAGGTPGTEICSYNLPLMAVDTGVVYSGSYPLYEYNATLPMCCTGLSDGWISIEAITGPSCWFLWMSGTGGDGFCYQWDGTTFTDRFYDQSLCMSGVYVPVYGACCDDSTGTCVDGVEQQDCPAPMRFVPDTLCADLDPACGDIVTCEHTIVLTDDYGDGWNGGTVDVLVNGIVVLNNLTLASGTGPVTFPFLAATGDAITTSYTAGSYSYENEYTIYDVNGTALCTDGAGGTTPVGCSTVGYCGPDPCAGVQPPNDDCVDATLVTTPYPQTVSGTNECANIDCVGVLDWNATWWEITLPYAVNNLTVDFCGQGFEINNVGVVVYDDCSDCNAYILYDSIVWDGCADGVTSPFITWEELPGPATVFFPVYFNNGAELPYTIEIDVAEVVVPENDLCVNAFPVSVPSLTPGTTQGATIDSDFPTCGTSITSAGVWYVATGTGTSMTASLCNGATSYDSKLSVYCGDCMMPVCVDGNDDSCGLQSEVTWCSQYGATYYILVHGFGSAAGPFELELFDDGIPCQADVKCLPEGACCLPDASCVVTNEIDCLNRGGWYQGDDTDCGTVAAKMLLQDCNDNIVGTLDGSSPIWDRIFGCNVDVNCNAACTDSSSNGQYYAAFPIQTTVAENLVCEVLAAGTTIGDTVLTLYCDPFDPNDPLSNAIAYDDDGGDGLLSAFLASDNIFLQPGMTYWLVLSTFSAGATGDFDICLEGNFFLGGGGPGACCLPDGTCMVMSAEDCNAAGGIFGGSGTDCETYVCPSIPGACCLPDGSCVVTTEECCEYAGGIFLGPGTDCGTGFQTMLMEDFSAGIPGSWMVTDDAGTGVIWSNIAGSGEGGNYTGGDGDCASASSDSFGTAAYDTSLITPMLDLGTAVSASLDFDANFQNFAGYDFFLVDVSYDGGFSWTNLLTWNEDHGSFRGTTGEHVTLDLGMTSAMTAIRFRYYDPVPHFNWYVQVDNVVVNAEIPGQSPCGFDLDIKPGSCPNSFNRKSNGVLPVALLGTDTFDVSMVDISTVRLARWDGVGGSVVPNEGPPGPHTVIDDVGTPYLDGEPCGCHELGPDGYMDLSMKFNTQDVVMTLELNGLPGGSMVPLVLYGYLMDGSPFVTGDDCLRLVPPGTPPGKVQFFSNSPGSWIDISPLDQTLDGGGYTLFERTYWLDTELNITAQENDPAFLYWIVDGVRQPFGKRDIQLLITQETHTLKAVYAPKRKIEPPGGTTLR